MRLVVYFGQMFGKLAFGIRLTVSSSCLFFSVRRAWVSRPKLAFIELASNFFDFWNRWLPYTGFGTGKLTESIVMFIGFLLIWPLRTKPPCERYIVVALLEFAVAVMGCWTG